MVRKKRKIKVRTKQDIERRRRIKRKSAISTTAFFVGLIILFLIVGLKTPLPLPEEKGINVILGEYDVGREETFEQTEEDSELQDEYDKKQVEETENIEEEIQEPQHSETSESIPTEEESITQETEDAPVISKKEETTEEKESTEETETNKAETDVEEKKEEKKPERKVDPRTLYNKPDKSKGQENQPGDKGSEEGDEDAKSFEKHGEALDDARGISFNLNGRNIARYPSINDESQKTGTVVVEIVVNKNGNVVRARAGARGSTTFDTRLLELAKKAALDTKFTSNSSAPEEQHGTITFNFKLR